MEQSQYTEFLGNRCQHFIGGISNPLSVSNFNAPPPERQQVKLPKTLLAWKCFNISHTSIQSLPPLSPPPKGRHFSQHIAILGTIGWWKRTKIFGDKSLLVTSPPSSLKKYIFSCPYFVQFYGGECQLRMGVGVPTAQWGVAGVARVSNSLGISSLWWDVFASLLQCLCLSTIISFASFTHHLLWGPFAAINQ